MEPFKALTFLAATAIVSLVGAGAVGFYAGYSAGRGNLEQLKAGIANMPIALSGPGGSVSLKPVLDDIRTLSRQVESLAAAKPVTASTADQGSKSVLDEMKVLSRQIDALKGGVQVSRSSEGSSSATQADYSGTLQEIREQLTALGAKADRQEKTPKALIDEIRLLSASVQTQEPNARRAIAEEVRNAVATLQNTEPKVNKTLMDEIRTISANTRPGDRAQTSVVDQVKILTATVESLKSRLSNEARGGGNEALGAEVAQLHNLLATASDQFGRCQMQLASSAGGGNSQAAQPGPAATTVAISQRPEPSTVVFYDNIMLKKDQEKDYDEIGVRLALQSVGARQVRVAVNRQGFGLAFGERKVFRSQDVECELNLMETNLNDSQARVSISCKR